MIILKRNNHLFINVNSNKPLKIMNSLKMKKTVLKLND